MKKTFLFSIASIGLVACSQPANEERQELSIMAAASLSDSLDELKSMYEEHENVELVINYGSSGQLRQQIEQGAPADLFLSASLTDMEQVDEAGEVIESAPLLENQLVLVATPEAADDIQSWGALASGGYQGLTIGQTDTVPAGRYAQQALESMGLWDELEPDLLYARDVRQVLTYVETGNADAGIVYATDALTSGDQIVIVEQAPEGSHEPIVYPVGLLTDDEAVRYIYSWLQGDEAMAVFESYGFERGD